MKDTVTMIWKEVKDSFLQGGRSALIRPLLLTGIMGVLLPWQLKELWIRLSPPAVLLVLYVPFLSVVTTVGDTIAGERERHTLETLLASRVSDRAILLGKLIVTVGFAWCLALASLLLGLVSANLSSGHGETWTFYTSPGVLLETLLLNLLTSLLAASGGILISLRAATVRQAQQTLVLCTVGLVACTIFAARAAASWAALASPASAARVWLIVAATLAVLDAILLGATFLRFQRSRLIL
jgi:ABC-2 type transport system permease protein